MQVSDLMRRSVVTVRDDTPVPEVLDLMVREHLHGVPVLDGDKKLVGVVTQQDVYFSAMTQGRSGSSQPRRMLVGDIMTAPAVSVAADTDLRGLCGIMHRLRIHRLPVVNDGKLVGIVSSLDICAAVHRGDKIV